MALGSPVYGGLQVLELSTSGGSGGLYLSGVNNEVEQPNTGGTSKDFDYPYYFDPSLNEGAGLWVVIASEPLNAAYSYTYEEANFTVLNKTVTDPDVGQFSIGNLEWDDASLTGSGIETIAAASLTLSLDLTDFSPMFGTHNINNEFFWDYRGDVSNLGGTGLTFQDGVLTSVDFTADVDVFPRFAGNDGAAFVTPYSGNVTFSGDSFQFNVDEILANNSSILGNIENSHLVFDAAGTFAIPEPSSLLLLISALGMMNLLRRKRD